MAEKGLPKSYRNPGEFFGIDGNRFLSGTRFQALHSGRIARVGAKQVEWSPSFSGGNLNSEKNSKNLKKSKLSLKLIKMIREV